MSFLENFVTNLVVDIKGSESLPSLIRSRLEYSFSVPAADLVQLHVAGHLALASQD